MEYNKLIAEFMGYVYEDDRFFMEDSEGVRLYEYLPHELQYHTSWDWLMPVLIEIERIIVGEVTWISTYCDIEREYKRAVEWIKKYNDNPKHMTLQ